MLTIIPVKIEIHETGVASKSPKRRVYHAFALEWRKCWLVSGANFSNGHMAIVVFSVELALGMAATYICVLAINSLAGKKNPKLERINYRWSMVGILAKQFLSFE